MKLSRIAAALFTAGSLVASVAFADTVTLNPSAPNTGAVNGSALSGTNGAFNTDKATTNFGSILTINSAPVVGASASFTETGFFLVDAFSGAPSSGVGINYNVYALFTITGTGTWLAPTFYSGNLAGLNISVSIYGSPGSASVNPFTPGVGQFGITPDASDFLLGTATLNTPVTAFATLGPGTGATTTFNATLDFTPAAGTTGINGFWTAPTPFDVALSTSATGIPPTGGNGTTYAVSGGKTTITTNVTPLKAGSGSGNILFSVNNVPEPGALALVGIALAGLGIASRRKA